MSEVDRIFTKRVDPQGRVTIPSDIREKEKIVPGGWATLWLIRYGRR